jgi:hypothetical protein
MKKSVISLQALIVAGIKLGQQAEQNRKDIRDDVLAFNTLEAQWHFVGTELMPLIARIPAYKGCKIVKTNRGSYQFVDAKTGARHEGARSYLRDRLSLTTLLAGSGNTSKTVRNKKESLSPVDSLLQAFEKLSLKQQREFLKRCPNVI